MSCKLFFFIISVCINKLECFYSTDLIRIGTKPNSCSANEEPKDCIEFCLPTCDRPKRSPCIFSSCLAACACKEGFIRDTENGKCVLISSCIDPAEIRRNYTIPCNENEISTDCKGYEATCRLRDVPVASRLYCEQGCICKNGFIRKDHEKECIPVEKC